MYRIIKNVKEDDQLRASFNKLAEETFGLNFENWYQNGFWNEKYIPYSIVKDNTVISNVSVNIIDMLWDGQLKHFIQLGTVMTDKAYRGQGMIRQIMKEIAADYEKKTDGMFLFANDSVLDFYPKFGFVKAKEYQYSREVDSQQEAACVSVPMKNKNDWSKMENRIKNSRFRGRFDMVNNSDLIMFYLSQFMQENVFYVEKSGAYVAAEVEADEVFLHAVFSEQPVEPEDVIPAFGKEIKRVTLGFVPQNTEKYQCTERHEEDTTLFVKGFDFESGKLMFPTLSHA